MAFAAELCFAFNIDDSATAYESLRGDAGWLAETEITHLVDSQAIDLSELGALDIHQNCAVGDQFLQAFLDQVEAERLLDDRLLDMLGRYQFCFFSVRPNNQIRSAGQRYR